MHLQQRQVGVVAQGGDHRVPPARAPQAVLRAATSRGRVKCVGAAPAVVGNNVQYSWPRHTLHACASSEVHQQQFLHHRRTVRSQCFCQDLG